MLTFHEHAAMGQRKTPVRRATCTSRSGVQVARAAGWLDVPGLEPVCADAFRLGHALSAHFDAAGTRCRPRCPRRGPEPWRTMVHRPMTALVVRPRHEPRAAAAFLAHLECAPGGFGQPSALAFTAALRARAHQHAGSGPLLLFLLGEPLSGKSTVLSNLLTALIGALGDAPPLQVRLIRWGDAMRAERRLGLLPADRVPGDLTAAEFAQLSAFVGEHIQAAATAIGPRPGLVVAELPGCTAVV